MNNALSKLLLSFERDCHATVQNGAKSPRERQIIQYLQHVQNFQLSNQEHNHFFKAIQIQPAPHLNDDLVTICNSKDFSSFQGEIPIFLKDKYKIYDDYFSQNTQKISKMCSRKNNNANGYEHGRSEMMKSLKSYKPNSRMENLLNKIKNHNEFYEYQTLSIMEKEIEKEIFLNNFITPLTLKPKEKKQNELYIPQPEENQKLNNQYKINPNSMAPKKQKLKKVQSNQLFL